MLQAVANAFRLPDLRKKIVFTLVILVIYRLAAHIPVPGVDVAALRQVFARNQLLGLFDMFSGGAMQNFSVMAMGVYPYITAQIVLQLLQPVIPALEELNKEGEAGRQKMSLYTHLLTLPMALLQGVGQISILSQASVGSGTSFMRFGLGADTWLPTLATLLTLTAGTMFAIWLGQLIDEQGIGNGMSIIIFGGIVAGIPQRLGQLWVSNPWSLLVFAVVTAITVDRHRVRTRRAAAHPGAIRQEGARHQGVRWPEHAYPAAGQLGGDDPADLCRVDHHVSRRGGQLLCGGGSCLGARPSGVGTAGL